jgi:hypothetical protein
MSPHPDAVTAVIRLLLLALRRLGRWVVRHLSVAVPQLFLRHAFQGGCVELV